MGQMRNLQLGQHDPIRFPKLKISHCDPLKVKLDFFEVQGYILHMLLPGMYYACDITKMFKLGHIDLIK